MVARPQDHAWSSYRHNALGRGDPLLGDHATYHALAATAAGRCAAYRALFAEGLDETMLTTLRDATQRGWVPGSDRFRREIEHTLGRRTDPARRGRPPNPKTPDQPPSPPAADK